MTEPGGVRHDPRILNHAHAERTLGDTAYLVYVLAQSAKLFLSLIAKRWPELR